MRHAANVLREGILAAVETQENDQVDFNDLTLKIHPQIADSLGMPVKGHENSEKHWGQNICSEAFKSGINGISSAMCDGPLVHHEYKLGIFLSSGCAVNQCADCDATVHLLTATFFSPQTGSCPTCSRARCSNCAAKAHNHLLNGRRPPAR